MSQIKVKKTQKATGKMKILIVKKTIIWRKNFPKLMKNKKPKRTEMIQLTRRKKKKRRKKKSKS
jgi:hypothetical protein